MTRSIPLTPFLLLFCVNSSHEFSIKYFPPTHALFLSKSKINCKWCHNTELFARTKSDRNLNENKSGTPKNGRKRMNANDLNELVRGIGLTPVTNSGPKVKRKRSRSNVKVNETLEYDDAHGHELSLIKHFDVDIESQLQYARNGHAAIRSILPAQFVSLLRNDLIIYEKSKTLDAYRQKVEVATDAETSFNCNNVKECLEILKRISNDANGDHNIELPFLQYFNTWKMIPRVRSLVISPCMTNLARTLLDVENVRLYQDSLFYKRSNDGPTPWHSDARMAPFDTSNMITIWIPLQHIPKPSQGGTGLYFVDKSHSDFALPYWNSPNHDDVNNEQYPNEYDKLDIRYGGQKAIKHHMPLSIGDCTVHAGWTLHCADANIVVDDHEDGNADDRINEGSSIHLFEKDRYALAVTYVDARAEIRQDVLGTKANSLGHNEDRWSYKDWIADVNPREYFEHKFVPIF